MDPELIKDVFTNIGEFRKPRINPLSRLLSLGVVSYEGEKWAKHRKIINPAFRIEKLKVFSFTFCFCLNPFRSNTCAVVLSKTGFLLSRYVENVVPVCFGVKTVSQKKLLP